MQCRVGMGELRSQQPMTGRVLHPEEGLEPVLSLVQAASPEWALTGRTSPQETYRGQSLLLRESWEGVCSGAQARCTMTVVTAPCCPLGSKLLLWTSVSLHIQNEVWV